MSFLARLSLANRGLIAFATVAILLFSAFVIPSLKQELFPSISFPAVSVITIDQGASPSIVERDVTDPLEQNIQGVSGLQSMTSYSNEGVSIIVVEYNFGTDLNQASQTLSQRINRAQTSLPSNITPQVQTYNIGDRPIIQLAVTSALDQQTLALALKQQVVPALQGINGVASATVTGVQNQIVLVTLDLKKLQALGLSVNQVEGALQANNIVLPAGELTANGQTVAIQVGNTFNSIQDLQNVLVGVHKVQTPTSGAGGTGGTGTTGLPPTGTQQPPQAKPVPPLPVKLSDVATVQESLAPSSTLTRTNGYPSIGISITKTADGNTVSISQALHDQISSSEQKLGSNSQITVISDQAPNVSSSVNGLVREGLIGAAFAIVVILFFLFSLRSTLVTAISIPLSIIIALIGLWVGNYSLNILTLGGLTIAIGRVVDDSIVVLENIYRHLGLGEDKGTAVFSGVKEVATAVTASTITTVSVFLPIAFTGGIVGELFQSFAITVTIALLASLFVALTIIPVLAYWFLKAPKSALKRQQQAHEHYTILEKGYVPLVRWVTRYRLITIVAAIVILVGSFSLVRFLGTNLFSNSSQNTYTISLNLPATTSLDQTDASAKQIEAILPTVAGIQTYQVTVGSGGTGFSSLSSNSNSATFSIASDPNTDQNTFQQTLQDKLNALPDAKDITLSSGGAGFSSNSIDVNVQASNDQTLRQVTQQVLDAVSPTPNTANVTSNLVDAAPLINVQVDPQKALFHAMTAAQVGQALRGVYTASTVTRVTINGEQQNVDIKLGTPANSVQAMQDLLILTPIGNVRLGDLATVTQISGPTQITHINAARIATVSLTVTSNNVGAVSSDVQKRVNKLTLPAGATVALGGITASQNQAFSQLGLALLAAILLVYLVMVGTFRSLVQPLILLVSIPFAATGSVLLMLATHTALGAPALIGLLMLVGIVVTNAIVLLDLVRQYRHKGLDARSAVIEGGRRRLRPILMTALATILALTPMALGLSPSSGFIAGPLAIVVIGGLASSTVLTLLLVPTLYVLVEDIRGRFSRSKNEPPAPSQVQEPEEKREVQAAPA